MNIIDNTRYPAILFISKVIRFFAWCSLFFTVLAMIIFLGRIDEGASAFAAIVGVGIIGGFFTLALFATAEGLIVLIDIEKNTRVHAAGLTGPLKTNNIENNFKIHPVVLTKTVENKPKNNENINSVSHAMNYLKSKGVQVNIRDGKYSIVYNGEIINFYKDSELIEYASTLF
jgi:hypothetical protein